MNYWALITKARRTRVGQESIPERVVDRCVAENGYGYSKEDLTNYAGCAADIYCAQYSVPPGICSEIATRIAGPIIEAIADTIDNAGSAPSASWWNIYQLRTLHDRLFPREPKWNSNEAWSQDAGFVIRGDWIAGDGSRTPAPPLGVPKPMYELLKRNGYDLTNDRTQTLLASTGQGMPTTLATSKPLWYTEEQTRFTQAASKAQAELISRKARIEAKRESGGSGLGVALGIGAAAGLGFLLLRSR